MNHFDTLIQKVPDIEAKIRYSFHDKSLITLAFIHRSYVNEHKEVTDHNERLEFLGDSVLGLIVSDYLYRELPQTPEGDLSYLRSRLVEASSCCQYIQKLKVEPFILLGKGERLNEGRGRETILADLFEAIVGAIYLDGGLEATRTFIFGHFQEDITAILRMPLQNWKAALQDFCQRNYQQQPEYSVLSESGPDHSKIFRIKVSIGKKELGNGEGSSKKSAQQAAAQDALERMKENHGN